ncbi:hypothetical protein HDU92_004405 [Lobulomyces angularis]|nr:hypothetical protein HDU92_004405 [Lobulomyces angularis]
MSGNDTELYIHLLSAYLRHLGANSAPVKGLIMDLAERNVSPIEICKNLNITPEMFHLEEEKKLIKQQQQMQQQEAALQQKQKQLLQQEKERQHRLQQQRQQQEKQQQLLSQQLKEHIQLNKLQQKQQHKEELIKSQQLKPQNQEAEQRKPMQIDSDSHNIDGQLDKTHSQQITINNATETLQDFNQISFRKSDIDALKGQKDFQKEQLNIADIFLKKNPSQTKALENLDHSLNSEHKHINTVGTTRVVEKDIIKLGYSVKASSPSIKESKESYSPSRGSVTSSYTSGSPSNATAKSNNQHSVNFSKYKQNNVSGTSNFENRTSLSKSRKEQLSDDMDLIEEDMISITFIKDIDELLNNPESDTLTSPGTIKNSLIKVATESKNTLENIIPNDINITKVSFSADDSPKVKEIKTQLESINISLEENFRNLNKLNSKVANYEQNLEKLNCDQKVLEEDIKFKESEILKLKENLAKIKVLIFNEKKDQENLKENDIPNLNKAIENIKKDQTEVISKLKVFQSLQPKRNVTLNASITQTSSENVSKQFEEAPSNKNDPFLLPSNESPILEPFSGNFELKRKASDEKFTNSQIDNIRRKILVQEEAVEAKPALQASSTVNPLQSTVLEKQVQLPNLNDSSDSGKKILDSQDASEKAAAELRAKLMMSHSKILPKSADGTTAKVTVEKEEGEIESEEEVPKKSNAPLPSKLRKIPANKNNRSFNYKKAIPETEVDGQIISPLVMEKKDTALSKSDSDRGLVVEKRNYMNKNQRNNKMKYDKNSNSKSSKQLDSHQAAANRLLDFLTSSRASVSNSIMPTSVIPDPMIVLNNAMLLQQQQQQQQHSMFSFSDNDFLQQQQAASLLFQQRAAAATAAMQQQTAVFNQFGYLNSSSVLNSSGFMNPGLLGGMNLPLNNGNSTDSPFNGNGANANVMEYFQRFQNE